jgi:hypothetical protein
MTRGVPFWGLERWKTHRSSPSTVAQSGGGGPTTLVDKSGRQKASRWSSWMRRLDRRTVEGGAQR